MKQLGSKIKKIREFKNLTQTYVAGQLGMSQSNYARIEGDYLSISEAQLVEIADILETNVSTITYLDERISVGLNATKEFRPNPQAILHFYQKLNEIYKEEAVLLKKKIELLETVLNN